MELVTGDIILGLIYRELVYAFSHTRQLLPHQIIDPANVDIYIYICKYININYIVIKLVYI